MSLAAPFPVEGLLTERLVLQAASRHHASALQRYSLDNRTHFKRWEPARPDEFYSLHAVESRLAAAEQDMAAASALYLMLLTRHDGTLIGCCNFTNIVRGVFQACHLGFSLGHAFEGSGFMHEALTAAIAYTFDTVGLHRIMANHRPENERSGRLLARLGFEREGFAHSYLKIDGQWADHVLTSLINPAERAVA
ncbi:GNAT family N-acetyltransferase [Trinickia fusca]|uniref:[Ribosomal protein uS5]-alanine N-acetyltransferase n=1 Tax=Trinickia fusca TaxID=2419777 RepID=A0A494XCC3_9BURK|nr:GNAT family N-acetyltransferase [Trinickia fusca]RKP45193.1 GNAT family N-acetyltransferase [Trinickia fusca]